MLDKYQLSVFLMEDFEPEISVIIPLDQASQLIVDTCESILAQTGVSFEVIIIDAKEDLQTSELIKSYQDPRLKVQALTNGSLFALINRGLLMARGKYVNILYAGCTYIAPSSLARAQESIRKHNSPDIFYSASYIYEHLYYGAVSEMSPQMGCQPTLLQACFFNMKLFKKIGYFNQALERRGTLDLFCRVRKAEDISEASEPCVYVEMFDYPTGLLNTGIIFRETWAVIWHYFGLTAALKWLFSKYSIAMFQKKHILDFVVP